MGKRKASSSSSGLSSESSSFETNEAPLPSTREPVSTKERDSSKEKALRRSKKKKKKAKQRKKAQVASNPSNPRAADEGTTLTQANDATPTVSIALPGSIINNAQSPELRTYVAGQIARAASIFCVDEVVVFAENEHADTQEFNPKKRSTGDVFLAHVLQYLEMPQYLRKSFFPVHSDLKFAGLLNPLDTPHHMRIDEVSPYREGVVLKRPVSTKEASKGSGSLVNAGMRKEVRIDKHLEPGVRVTLQIAPPEEQMSKKTGRGRVVAPTDPKDKGNLYWGYQTRMAKNLTAVFKECPYPGGYDYTVGTSDKGKTVADPSFRLPDFKHLLIVFGGLGGIESCIEGDDGLTVNAAEDLFDVYVNTCPQQGSRTIRTEEAILISLAALRPEILRCGATGHNPSQ